MSRILATALGVSLLWIPVRAQEPFAIEVVDDSTGRGVPLVELETVHHVRLYTDSAGIVAFHEPSLMGQKVFFSVRGHGYEFPKDGFGFRGKALLVTPGGRARLTIRRINIAERLYRVTGADIYRHSQLVGAPTPIRHPLLNAQVMGSDSVTSVLYRQKIYWFWGDTNRPSYPLGNFQVTGATSELPGRGGLSPAVGVDLTYFVGDDGFARATAKLPGDGATWLSGLVALRDEPDGRERLFAHYVKVRLPLDIYERGLAEFDDGEQRFRKVAAFANEEPFPHGAHPFAHTVNGKKYIYYADPFPLTRVPADPESLRQQDHYEVFTSLKVGSRLEHNRHDRDEAGRLRYGWKTKSSPLRPGDETKRVRDGAIAERDRLTALRDPDSGKPVVGHRGSVYWNEYRGRWVMIVGEIFGASVLGETWYAEADRPLGPWVYARKIVTHEKYGFYNPKQQPLFDEEKGRFIYFEGTYSDTFSASPSKTPRYDYNQIMYRLDLADPRLNLPVAVYETSDVPNRFSVGLESGSPSLPVAFWALDRPGPTVIPVYETRTREGMPALRLGDSSETDATGSRPPLFYAFAPGAQSPPETTVALFEFSSEDGRQRGYATEEGHPGLRGFKRSSKAFARVWRHPLRRVNAGSH